MIFDQYRHEISTPELPKIARLVPFERHLSAVRWQFIRGVLTGILVSSAVAIPVFKYSNVRQRGVPVRQERGQTVLGGSDAQAASGGRKSTSETAGRSSPPSIPSILSIPQPSTPSNHFPDSPVEPALAKDRAKSPASFPVNRPVPITDRPSSEPAPAKETLSRLAQLWASFEAGNSKAAVALADVYLRGDGVPVNCEQARVLLFVASKQNNAEATKKLRDLDETGCPAP
jgi:hypothetical protein